MSNTDFHGRSVVVTGAGSGIGRAAAVKFAAQGAKVLVADLNQEAADLVVKEIEAADGIALAVCGDLADQEVVDRVAAAAVDAFGGISVLVNNAGVMDRMSALGETDDDEWERVIAVNLTAPFRLTRAALPYMQSAGGGAIVFTASEAALRGSAAGAAYTASKHAVAGLVKNLAVMYRGQGIRTNAVAPGATATAIQVDVRPDAHGPTVVGTHVMNNMGRITEPEEQADAIVFLASDAAGAINGAILTADDGWSAV